MNILKPNTGSQKFRNDWRRARLPILEHIRLSKSWSDIIQGTDVLFHVSFKARSLIKEQEMFEDRDSVTSESADTTQEDKAS